APLVMNHSSLIDSYKSTAQYGLSQGIRKGHPEAYLAMSQALMLGVVFPKDPITAYAYLRVAELRAADERWMLQRTEFYKERMSDYLSHEQIAEAEHLALELWKDSQTENSD
ncbi:MAG: hypothetical protein R3212_13755, partial [Xanthomonadales bacterium]|nr:hypothetical protein [Xanthomonadales bacterium]